MSISPELSDYIQKSRASGISNNDIRQALLTTGWNPSDVESALNPIQNPNPTSQSEIQNTFSSPSPILKAEPAPVQTANPVVQQIKPQEVVPAQAEAPAKIIAEAPLTPTTSFTAFKIDTATAQSQTNPARPSRVKAILIAVIVFLFVAVLAGATYAYIQKIGPFAKILYTEGNIVSGLLSKSSEINTSTYLLALSLKVAPRDTGATPFAIQISNEGQMRELYQNDAERGQNVSTLLSVLNEYYYNNKSVYPNSLKKLESEVIAKNSYYKSRLSLNDPVTEIPYEYSLTDNGKNFALKFNFQTPGAIRSIRRYSFVATSTPIQGQTVTFTKDSSSYLYLSSEPPKPFFVQLEESMRSMPPEIAVSASISATTDWGDDSRSDWKFGIDGEGDLGDLSYAVNVEAMHKDDIYYFRINKIPSLFLSMIGGIKGQWVKVDPKTASSSSSNMYNPLSSFSTDLPEAEESYKKYRADALALIKKVAGFADEENLFAFSKTPRSETVDKRSLIRYDLKIRKESIVPFYRKLLEETSKNKNREFASALQDDGLLEYLQSKEFSDVFDYYQKNTGISIWVDRQGFPAIIQYTVRVVPPDTALQLKDKQINIISKLVFSGINEAVVIEAPTDAKPLEQLIEETSKNQYDYNPADSTSAVRADLSQVRLTAELAFDKDNSYGKKAYPLGACEQIADTLFADEEVYKMIQNASDGDASKATCASESVGAKVDTYAVSVPLPNLPGYSWCVDNTGASKQITGTLSGSSCK